MSSNRTRVRRATDSQGTDKIGEEAEGRYQATGYRPPTHAASAAYVRPAHRGRSRMRAGRGRSRSEQLSPV